jgi:uncharacterized membrane protein YcaP (DUF421 family)
MDQIKYAVLECNGGISIIPKSEELRTQLEMEDFHRNRVPASAGRGALAWPGNPSIGG